jgi:sarcosine oxidase, subunit beta
MPTIRAEVAIVGGGLMGCWTAYFLSKRGRSVVVLEKGVVGAQASGVNFGNLRLQARFLLQLPLALRSHALWEEIESLVGDRCEATMGGHLRIAFTAAEVSALEEYAREAQPHGLDLEILDQTSLRRRWPWLARATGASWSPRDGSANPRGSAPAVARAAKRLGAEVIEGARVVMAEKRGDAFYLATDRDVTVESDILVNAAGAWSSEIAEFFGESAPIFAAGPPQFVTEPVPFFIEPCVQAVDGSVIFRQVARGNVVFAGYPRGPSDAVNNRAPVAPRKTITHMAHLGEAVPALAHCSIIRVWSGIEGYLPDMLPVIGRSPAVPGLYHAFGFCGHGFQLAPGVGLVMSELIVDGRTATPLEPFAIARFKGRAPAGVESLAAEFDASLRATPG